MADRFSGDVMIGGKISGTVFVSIKDMLDFLEDDLDDDGTGVFCECTGSDFTDLRAYCKEKGVALAIYWDAKWEYGATVEFHIDGKEYNFDTDSNGRIVITVDELESNKHLSIQQFIDSLEIPEFPELEVVND